jgi:hypothetical protein
MCQHFCPAVRLTVLSFRKDRDRRADHLLALLLLRGTGTDNLLAERVGSWAPAQAAPDTSD